MSTKESNEGSFSEAQKKKIRQDLLEHLELKEKGFTLYRDGGGDWFIDSGMEKKVSGIRVFYNKNGVEVRTMESIKVDMGHGTAHLGVVEGEYTIGTFHVHCKERRIKLDKNKKSIEGVIRRMRGYLK